MKIRHKTTGKIYIVEDPEEWGVTNLSNCVVRVRTNAEVYPDEFYDFSRTQRDGCTMSYVEEPLSDFQIIGDKDAV